MTDSVKNMKAALARRKTHVQGMQWQWRLHVGWPLFSHSSPQTPNNSLHLASQPELPHMQLVT